jgi:hypothetical protein
MIITTFSGSTASEFEWMKEENHKNIHLDSEFKSQNSDWAYLE